MLLTDHDLFELNIICETSPPFSLTVNASKGWEGELKDNALVGPPNHYLAPEWTSDT